MRRWIQIKPKYLLMIAYPMMNLAYADGARDWENVPINTNILFGYYTYSNSEVSVDPALPIDGLSIDAHVPILRYARTFDLNGQVGGLQLVAPFGRVTGRVDNTHLKTSAHGVGDIAAIFVANIYGAPALTKKEFTTWTPQPYLTGSLSVTAPTGDYNGDDLLNMGKNRWTFKPQLSYGYYLNSDTLLAINTNIQFFTHNNEYKNTGTLAQKELFGVEAHLSKNLNPKSWLAISSFYSYGGETKVNNENQGNKQKTLRVGIGGNYNINSATALSISLNRSVMKESYTPDVTNFSINISRAF